MEVTIEELLLIIGTKEVELANARQQIAGLTKRLQELSGHCPQGVSLNADAPENISRSH